MDDEPAVIISTIAAFLVAVIGLAVAFGAPISPDQRDAIIGVVGPTVFVIFLVGPVIRRFVWSRSSVDDVRTGAIAGVLDANYAFESPERAAEYARDLRALDAAEAAELDMTSK